MAESPTMARPVVGSGQLKFTTVLQAILFKVLGHSSSMSTMLLMRVDITGQVI